jgi:hypothetical protein
MKNLLIILLVLITTPTYAADFTITLQGSASGSEKNVNLYRKSNNTLIGPYVSLAGSHAVKRDTKHQIIGRSWLMYESSDCTGAAYAENPSLPLNAYGQNGSLFFKIIGPVVADKGNINSRKQDNGECMTMDNWSNSGVQVEFVPQENLYDFTGCMGYFDSNYFTNKLE